MKACFRMDWRRAWADCSLGGLQFGVDVGFQLFDDGELSLDGCDDGFLLGRRRKGNRVRSEFERSSRDAQHHPCGNGLPVTPLMPSLPPNAAYYAPLLLHEKTGEFVLTYIGLYSRLDPRVLEITRGATGPLGTRGEITHALSPQSFPGAW